MVIDFVFFNDTETARINRLILMGGNTGMTELQFLPLKLMNGSGAASGKNRLLGMPTMKATMTF